MKIGVVTYCNVPNYGALLQAYALQTYLTKRGHEVFLLNYEWGPSRAYPTWRVLCSKGVARLKSKLKINAELRMAEHFAPNLKLTQRLKDLQAVRMSAPACDVYLVGSDQMWNTTFNRQTLPLVFLDTFDPKAIRLSYAVSFGLSEIPEGLHDELRTYMQKFQAISMREDSGVQLVMQVAQRVAGWHCDPTLLLTAGDYGQLCACGERDGGYIFSYLLSWKTNNRERCLACVSRALAISRVLTDGAKPVGILERVFDSPHKADVTVWLQRISGAAFVFTNSFHGTIFSILFHRPFVTLLLADEVSVMNSRVVSLLERLGLQDRIFDGDRPDDIERIVLSPIDWNNVDLRLQKWKTETNEYFENNGL